uniref:Uncharacterized protein n=1 Tax=Cercocebus atys TaxID=9531 RepID=A0A2K5L050_CERAT
MSGSSRMGTTTSRSGSEPPAVRPAKARVKMPSRSMAPGRHRRALGRRWAGLSGRGRGLRAARTLVPPTLRDSRQLPERRAKGGRLLPEQRACTRQPALPTCAFPSKARPGSLSTIAVKCKDEDLQPRTSGRCRAASRNRSHSQRSKPGAGRAY